MVGVSPSLPVKCGLPQHQRKIVEDLWCDGFVTITGLLSAGDTATLQGECVKLMQESDVETWSESAKYAGKYRVPVFRNAEWSVLGNIAGLSGSVDAILDDLLTNEQLAGVLRSVLGNNYKIRQMGIRRSEGTDPGMRMHQDARGEFGMAVLLNDVPDAGGTTAFLPGSHRFPLTSVEAGMPFIHPKYLRRWAKPATGRPGDVCLFFNKTWHGRMPAVDAKPHDAIMLSLFGAGYEMGAHDLPEGVVQNLRPELRRLLDPSCGLRHLQNGRYLIVGGEEQSSRLIDEAYRVPSNTLHPSQFLRLLRLAFEAGRPVKRWLKG